MKKILCYVLLIVLSSSFIGCSPKEQRIELTSENIEKYFTFDFSLVNFKEEQIENGRFYDYRGVVEAQMKVSPKKNIKTENVVVEAKFNLGGLPWMTVPAQEMELVFDENGHCEITKIIETDWTMMRPDQPTASTPIYTEIKGVIITK